MCCLAIIYNPIIPTTKPISVVNCAPKNTSYASSGKKRGCTYPSPNIKNPTNIIITPILNSYRLHDFVIPSEKKRFGGYPNYY